MAKTRMLKHELRTSEKVASWPIEIRYFWTLLWGYVDDHGKGKDSPLLVKADCFPLDPGITADVVDGWLWHLVDAGVVLRYTVDDNNYLAVINWAEHQRPPHPTKDILPRFDAPGATLRELHASRMKDAGEVHASLTPVLGWVESGFGSVIVNESSPAVMESAFTEAYSHWPKKVERKAAYEKFKAATRQMPVADLVAHIIRFGDAYAATTAKQFTPALGVWLSHERWDDELPTAPVDAGKQTPTQRAHQTLSLATDLDTRELER